MFRRINQIGDMLQSPRCGNDAAIETKEICEELREYFINKGAISWQQFFSPNFISVAEIKLLSLKSGNIFHI